ncbi:MAG: restriction endonuclease subunit S [Clostridia bacterium]|nr:restriction endonuclease subunit S [Clostridia bacterium]
MGFACYSCIIVYDDVLLGGDLTVIRTKLNGAFLSNQLNGVRRKKIATIAQGASIVHLHADELKKINITYPTREEQDKIAHFIDCLDERIATQNKIIKNKKSLIISLIIEILLSVLSLVESFLSLNLFSMINNLLKLLWTIFKEVKRIWSKKKT